jgi:hypothetical protein
MVLRIKLFTLFRPDLNYGPRVERAAPVAGKPLRLVTVSRPHYAL